MVEESIVQLVEQLRKDLHYHGHRYYVLDDPEISDYAYDMMYRQLEDIEAKYPELITSDSPTQRVGGKILNGFAEVRHEVKMLSLRDVFSYDELKEFYNKTNSALGYEPLHTVDLKIDGLSVEIEYLDGTYFRASTRGSDGIIGEDVTAHVKTIKSVPLVLTERLPRLVVRGEVYMPKASFQRLNEEFESKGLDKFKNCRNAAAGSLRQLDPNVTASRNLDIFIFNIQIIEGKVLEAHSESMLYLKQLGFKTCDGWLADSLDKAWDIIQNIGNTRGELSYDIDGAVIKVDSFAHRNTLGVAEKWPFWAVAYKYEPEKAITTVEDIIITVGRTGVLTPTAIISPVVLEGSTVSSATCNNFNFLKNLDIRIKDFIFIHKAGSIIPEIIGVVDPSKRTGEEEIFTMPDNCPCCGAPVVRYNDEAKYYCTGGVNCPAQLLRGLEHFTSKDAMDIEGLGPEIIEKFYNNGYLNNLEDIYLLKDKKDKLIQLEGMGSKSVQKLLEAIEKSKRNNIDRLIYGFGINCVGIKNARILANAFNSIEDLAAASFEKIISLEDFGEVKADSVVKFFSLDRTCETIRKMNELGVNMLASHSSVSDTRFSGMTFVITGTFDSFSRDEAEGLIISRSGRVTKSVSMKTSYLVIGKAPGANKVDDAETNHIPTLNEAQFKEMLYGTADDLQKPADNSFKGKTAEEAKVSSMDDVLQLDVMDFFNSFKK